MVYAPVALEPGTFGLDTSYKLTLQPGLVDKLIALDLSKVWTFLKPGTYLDFFMRYVPLPGNNPGWDIDGTERQLIADKRKKLVLVQHVRAGAGNVGWTCTAAQGAADAAYAAGYAKGVGYAPVDGYPPPAIVKDMENVANPGPVAVACMGEFRDALARQGYRGPGYRGYSSGLTTGQWAAVGTPVMSDAGTHNPPPGRGYAIKQHAQKTIFGVAFDLDEVLVDQSGDAVYGMAEVDEVDEGPPEPHLDPGGTNT